MDGVSIFFVLSGFLIGGILFNEFEKNEKNLLFNFWAKRWLRTLPAYYFTLTFIVCVRLFYDQKFSFDYVEKYYLFIQNFNSIYLSIFGESWSLSVEEWFYLLIPLLFFIFNKKLQLNIKTTTIIISIGLIIVITLYRYVRFDSIRPETINDWNNNFRLLVTTRIDSLMYGVLAAFLKKYYASIWLKHKGIKFLIGIVLLVLFSYIPHDFSSMFMSVFFFSIISLSVFLILPFLESVKRPKNLFIFNLITLTSITSYSMYLLNECVIKRIFIMDVFTNKIYHHLHLPIGIKYYVDYLLYWFLIFTLSILMYKYIEQPFIKLRNKVL